MKWIVTILMSLSVAGCSFHSDIVFPTDKWVEVKPGEVSINSQTLNRAVEFLELNSGRDGSHELMIIRGGQLVYKGDSIDKVHGVWSCTKSFTSTVSGLIIDDDKAQLNTIARDIIPQMAETFPDLTLLHFATMTSGYVSAGDTLKEGYTHGSSREPFIPGKSALFAPGTKYAYWDAAMNQFANILTHIAKEPLDDVFRRRIADPIGMNENAWHWGDFGEVDGLKVVGGAGNFHKGIFISANEFARFGLLFLNEGNWDGNQLISREWVRQSTKVQVPQTMEWGSELSDIHGMGVYGYNWWVNGIQPNGERLWPDAPANTYAALGYNNNVMFVIPDWDMVVVRLGLDARDIVISDSTWNEFLGIVGSSIENHSN